MRAGKYSCDSTRLALGLSVGAMALLAASTGWAGNNNWNRNQVGGVSVDAKGVVGQPVVKATQDLRRLRIGAMEKIPAKLNSAAELRKISLTGIEAAIARTLQNNISGMAHDLPDAVRYLAGIQRIEYVFVYPEKNDVVLAGPGEGWKVDENANVVGVTTNRPVIRIEDLMVAMRSVHAARQVGVSCSIDPTPEGRQALQKFLSRQKHFSPAVVPGVEKSLGPQNISITGVPEASHFARVLVASDYQMKRISMKLDPSPVSGLPSFLDMLTSTRGLSADVMPRWWLACNYEPFARGENGLAWQLRGPGVKAMTENDFISATGQIKGTGKTNPVAQKWADTMTAKYDDLSLKRPVFATLRNLMDMCVVAALIEKEGLLKKANLSLPLLTDPDSKLVVDPFQPPKRVPSQCSYVKRGRSWIVTASGGVQIESWRAAGRSERDDKVDHVRSQAAASEDRATWWWN